MCADKAYNTSEHKDNFKILIVVPTTNLKDNEWVDEINKWFPYLKDCVYIECIQTAYKRVDVVDLLIVDEIHTTLSPEYRKLYSIADYKNILGLTATKPHNKEYNKFLQSICPIIFECDMEESRQLKLISGFKVINIPISLTRDERAKYKRYDLMFTNSLIELSKHGNAFEIANEARIDKKHAHHKTAIKFWMAMSKRR
jgi:superfamily II DNA or RNA helicase